MPQLPISDEYFNRSARIVSNTPYHDRRVRYRVFARDSGVLAGLNRSVAFVANQCVGPLRIYARRDGEHFKPLESVMVIEGLFGELVNLETTYLGMLAFSGAATRMAEIVKEAQGVPVVDMAARHYPWEIIEQSAYAAAMGHAAGTSTRAGYNYVHKWFGTGDGDHISVDGQPPRDFRLYGSIPHALNAVYDGSSVRSASAFHERLPDIPLTVLIDYEGRELDVCREAFQRFGPALAAVRLDTHGGRVHQGGSERPDPVLVETILQQSTDKDIVRWALDRYGFGPGVTIQAVYNVRRVLDEMGARQTRLMVSSGFDADKVRAFMAAKVPIDGIGTGSWVEFFVFTSDVTHVWESGRWAPRSKAGREASLGEPGDLPLLVDQN